MKIVSVIGTRPQYVKAKPLSLCLESSGIDHLIVDTNQHFSTAVSEAIIHDLDLRVDCNLSIENHNPNAFRKQAIRKLTTLLNKDTPDLVIVIGDTNSAVAGARAAKKNGLPLAHLESGIRCGDLNRPEEVNRIFVDELADLHFISREEDAVNVSNPRYTGDLEYALLNLKEPIPIEYHDYLLMTVHRQENTTPQRLNEIFSFCSELGPILFPLHHRTESVIKAQSLFIPPNIEIRKPLTFSKMVHRLANCRGVLTDSCSVVKTCPYFGKKCIILLPTVEWSDVIHAGYGTPELRPDWFEPIQRKTGFYYNPSYAREITDAINELLSAAVTHN